MWLIISFHRAISFVISYFPLIGHNKMFKNWIGVFGLYYYIFQVTCNFHFSQLYSFLKIFSTLVLEIKMYISLFPNGIDLKYIDKHVTHLQLTKWFTAVIYQQSWTILMISWSSSILRISEPASMTYIICLEESGTISLDDSVNAIASFKCSCHVKSLGCNDVIIFP